MEFIWGTGVTRLSSNTLSRYSNGRAICICTAGVMPEPISIQVSIWVAIFSWAGAPSPFLHWYQCKTHDQCWKVVAWPKILLYVLHLYMTGLIPRVWSCGAEARLWACWPSPCLTSLSACCNNGCQWPGWITDVFSHWFTLLSFLSRACSCYRSTSACNWGGNKAQAAWWACVQGTGQVLLWCGKGCCRELHTQQQMFYRYLKPADTL